MNRFYKLKRIDNNKFKVTIKKEFFHDVVLSFDETGKAYEFASAMVNDGEHRKTRSGGQASRNKKEIFANTFEGKLAELGFYSYCVDNGVDISEPDFSVSGLGIWDSYDFKYKEKYIAIKSTARYSQLLLLEIKDWNANGQYIPNIDNGKTAEYDYIVLCRVNPIVKGIVDKAKDAKDIKEIEYEVEITGYITHEDVKYIINNNYVLEQNSYLNKTKMDASNYYVQANDLREPEELIKKLSKTDKE